MSRPYGSTRSETCKLPVVLWLFLSCYCLSWLLPRFWRWRHTAAISMQALPEAVLLIQAAWQGRLSCNFQAVSISISSRPCVWRQASPFSFSLLALQRALTNRVVIRFAVFSRTFLLPALIKPSHSQPVTHGLPGGSVPSYHKLYKTVNISPASAPKYG